MTLFLIPALWILFFANPKWMTFLVALSFTVGHVSAIVALEAYDDHHDKRLAVSILVTAISIAVFVGCFTVWPCQRLDI